jgi:UDP-N-acetylglucosamine--N-acetylmuramyl-(pentapeptide) pyrophosphoryl-undecaprenol N-acetylglucosamine transferase
MLHYYPLAECLAAFDAAISAAGYNSANELLHHGVPTIFLPVEKGVDDQQARAARIAAAGAGLLLADPSDGDLATTLAHLLEPQTRAVMSEQARALARGGGAATAAWAILALD